MPSTRTQTLGAAAAGVAFVLALASLAPPLRLPRPSTHPRPPAASRPAPAARTLAEGRRQARLRAERELDRADAEARLAVEQQLGELDAIFVAARRGLPRFADRVLGLEGQLALVADWLTWSSRHHARAIDAAFRECVLDPDRLERDVEQAIAGTLDALRAIDDALLIRLRQDLESPPATVPIDLAGRAGSGPPWPPRSRP